jgi:transposase, IS5 family
LYRAGSSERKKPKTYRKTARKNYLQVAKQRKPTRSARRKAIKQQLHYLRRNLATIEKLGAEAEAGRGLERLSTRQYRMLLVVSEVYNQQQQMYVNNQNRVDDRIVSLTQPHIRPIVRGKAGNSVEFGAKLSASCWDGYVFLDRISWDNFNESGDLIAQVESFKKETGYYPESVHADKIYRTKANKLWCQERGIRLSGAPLGRPPKNSHKTRQEIARQDEKIRNCIEGKFGQGKRRFRLGRVMTKLAHTSETAIAISFLVMNLERLLRQFLGNFYSWLLISYFSPQGDRINLYGSALIQSKLICCYSIERSFAF